MPKLWREHGPRAIRFATVGVLNTGIDIGLFNLFVYLAGWPVLLANTVSYTAGLANSYALNRIWTFGDVARGGARPALFVGLNLVGLGLGNVAIYVLAAFLPAWLAKLVTVAVTFVWNYWTSHRFVFVRP